MLTACWDCGYKGNEDTPAVEELTVSTEKNIVRALCGKQNSVLAKLSRKGID